MHWSETSNELKKGNAQGLRVAVSGQQELGGSTGALRRWVEWDRRQTAGPLVGRFAVLACGDPLGGKNAGVVGGHLWGTNTEGA